MKAASPGDTRPARPEHGAGSRQHSPAVVWVLYGTAVVLALGLLSSAYKAVFGDGDNGTAAGAAVIQLVQPAGGDTVYNPVTLRFTTRAPLRLTNAGWSAGSLHLHALVDGREHMPAAGDLSADGAMFVWRLPELEPGRRQIVLLWAGRDHADVRGPTDTVHVHVAR